MKRNDHERESKKRTRGVGRGGLGWGVVGGGRGRLNELCVHAVSRREKGGQRDTFIVRQFWPGPIGNVRPLNARSRSHSAPAQNPLPANTPFTSQIKLQLQLKLKTSKKKTY